MIGPSHTTGLHHQYMVLTEQLAMDLDQNNYLEKPSFCYHTSYTVLGVKEMNREFVCGV